MTKTRSAHGVPEIQSPLSLIYALVRDHHPHLAFNSAISWMLNHGKTLMNISSRVRTWSPLLIPVVTCQCCAVSAFSWSKQVSRLLIYHRGLRHRWPVIEWLEWWPLVLTPDRIKERESLYLIYASSRADWVNVLLQNFNKTSYFMSDLMMINDWSEN